MCLLQSIGSFRHQDSPLVFIDGLLRAVLGLILLQVRLPFLSGSPSTAGEPAPQPPLVQLKDSRGTSLSTANPSMTHAGRPGEDVTRQVKTAKKREPGCSEGSGLANGLRLQHARPCAVFLPLASLSPNRALVTVRQKAGEWKRGPSSRWMRRRPSELGEGQVALAEHAAPRRGVKRQARSQGVTARLQASCRVQRSDACAGVCVSHDYKPGL